MKNFRFLLPLVAIVFALTIAWTNRPNRVLSDLVWFEQNTDGSLVSATAGTRGDNPPVPCPGGSTPCYIAFSISEGEASLNSGSTTVYHLNSGVDISSDFNDERTKQ